MHNDNNNNETETREVPPAKFCLHSINKSLKKEYINVAVAVGVGVAAAAAFAIKHIDTERAKRWELAEVGPFWGPIIIIIIIGLQCVVQMVRLKLLIVSFFVTCALFVVFVYQ